VAKQYGVDYWRVLQFSELLDESPPKPADWSLPHLWMVATCLAWRQERARRFDIGPKMIQWSVALDPTSWDASPTAGSVIMSVKGDCGHIHPTLEGWQSCPVCEGILKSRLRDQ
jgi:hypothetical protein